MLELLKQGRPLENEYIVDGHMHICYVGKFFTRGSMLEEIIEKMDCIGINTGVISNLWDTGCYCSGNKEVIKAVEKYPGRFMGMIVLNPNYPENYEKELQYCFDSGCFRAMKLHPAQHQYPADGEFYYRIYSIAAEKEYPVLLHTWGVDDIKLFNKLARDFPETDFILGHSGGELPAVLEAIKLAQKFNNVFLDTACSWMYSGLIEKMVEGAGAEKVLFGSDAVWNSTEAGIGRIMFADITDEQKRLILGMNAKKLMKL